MPQPLKSRATTTRTKVDVSRVALATIIAVCSLMLIGAFGAAAINGIVSLTMSGQRIFVRSHVIVNKPDATQYPLPVPVLAIAYYPLKGNLIDTAITGWDVEPGTTLNQMRSKIDLLNQQLIEALNKGSIYHGYKDSQAKASLNYQIYKAKEFLKAVPLANQSGDSPADHMKILQQKSFNICDYVENHGVKEVWIWMYHCDGHTNPNCVKTIYPVESYQRGPNHALGNGYMDLPLCKKSYTVYDYNYGRGIGEALEDHTHHIERILDYADHHIYWDLFTGGSTEFQQGNKASFYNNPQAVYRCGWTHCPPNVIIANCSGDENQSLNRCTCDGYNWFSQRNVLSDCENWQPDGLGRVKQVNCRTWSGSDNCYSSDPFIDGNVGFKIWWMQNIPGANNNLTYQGKAVRNWWDFVGDFDNAISRGRSLAQ